ncbi:MAG: NUDIX hydrolase [Candidatus Staskawiczbacteria bacterium]
MPQNQKALFNLGLAGLPSFTIGVFGLAAKIIGGVVRIKVNVRTDQERQWQAAKLNPIPGVQIIDCPGGGVCVLESLEDALKREIREETGGCDICIMGRFRPPIPFINNDPSKPSDLAVWAPVVLIGDPKPSNEASSHPWITREQLEAETEYRCVSGLGNKGRTGQMLRAAFDWYEDEANRKKVEIFSRPTEDPFFVCERCQVNPCVCGK